MGRFWRRMYEIKGTPKDKRMRDLIIKSFAVLIDAKPENAVACEVVLREKLTAPECDQLFGASIKTIVESLTIGDLIQILKQQE